MKYVKHVSVEDNSTKVMITWLLFMLFWKREKRGSFEILIVVYLTYCLCLFVSYLPLFWDVFSLPFRYIGYKIYKNNAANLWKWNMFITKSSFKRKILMFPEKLARYLYISRCTYLNAKLPETELFSLSFAISS